jgi:protein-S-isoprenylcysteine O-methyltransferase Ste14
MPVHIILLLIFVISESPMLVFKTAGSSKVKNARDKLSLLILCGVIPVYLGLTFWVADYHIWKLGKQSTVNLTSMIVFGIGFIIRRVAIYQLGKMFTLNVVIRREHILKTDGLYNIVRHPGYLGYLLMLAGISISFNSLLSIVITLAPAFIALNYRINVEESALEEEFDKQYKVYKKTVKRLVPWVY